MATQQDIRRALASSFDDMGLYIVSSATSANVTLAAISDTTTNASTERYNGAWVYGIPAATGVGQQRRVPKGAFVVAGGVLGLELAWSPTLATSDTVEITHLFPSGEHPLLAGGVSGEDSGYNAFINRARSMIVTPDRVGLAIVQGAVFYSTVAWVEWLDREDRLIRVLEPGVTGGLPTDAAWRGWTLRLDAETPGLEVQVPFSASSGTLYLDVMRPDDTWNGTSGIWAEATGGFTNNLQECRAPVNDVVKVARMLALEALMARGHDARWKGMYPAAVQAARSVRYFDRSQESPQAQAVPAEAAA